MKCVFQIETKEDRLRSQGYGNEFRDESDWLPLDQEHGEHKGALNTPYYTVAISNVESRCEKSSSPVDSRFDS